MWSRPSKNRKLENDVKLAMRRRLVASDHAGAARSGRVRARSAARTVRHIALDMIDENIVEALGQMLIETLDRDPDPALAAVLTLQAIAASPYAVKSIRFLKSVIADPEKDAEIREQAFTVLVQTAAGVNAAFPEVTSVLNDRDVRSAGPRRKRLGIGPPRDCCAIGETAIAALVERLRDEDGVGAAKRERGDLEHYIAALTWVAFSSLAGALGSGTDRFLCAALVSLNASEGDRFLPRYTRWAQEPIASFAQKSKSNSHSCFCTSRSGMSGPCRRMASLQRSMNQNGDHGSGTSSINP